MTDRDWSDHLRELDIPRIPTRGEVRRAWVHWIERAGSAKAEAPGSGAREPGASKGAAGDQTREERHHDHPPETEGKEPG